MFNSTEVWVYDAFTPGSYIYEVTLKKVQSQVCILNEKNIFVVNIVLLGYMK